MKLWHAPAGKLIRGHVLDVSLPPFLRALKDLDLQLYVKWNPRKMRGEGCWEFRRRPALKTSVHKGNYQGNAIYQLEYVEDGMTCHIMDAAFLNYDAIRKLKTMDTWSKDHWIHQIDYLENKQKTEARQKSRDALKYAIKQHKSATQELFEMVRSGINPGQIINSTKWEMK